MIEPSSMIKIAARLKDLLGIDYLNDDGLMANVSLVNLAPGQTLFVQGEEAKSCFLVISGSLKIVMKNGDSESVMTIISKGELGGALLMSAAPRNYPGSVIAITQVSLLSIPKDTYLNQWMKHPKALNFINNCVRNRMRHLQEDKLLQLSDVQSKILHFLHRHYLEKADLVSKKVTRKEIALAVGAKTETVIRALKKLERAGVIKTQRSVINILDKSYIKKHISNES